MENITVIKDDLVETLRANRDEHRSMFLKAQERYREKWIELLDQRLDEVRRGEKINRFFSLPEPEDHTKDFDTAIEMLQWETGDEVEISLRDFQQFVQNNWVWNQSFAASVGTYLAE